MKIRIIIAGVIATLLFGGYLVSNQFSKKESDTKKEEIVEVQQEEVPQIEETKEESKQEEKKEEKKVETKKKTTTQKTTTKKQTKQTNVSYNKAELQQYAHDLVISYGWTEYDYECLVKLWNRESGWNPNAVNKKSGACGIPQAYPCSKASKGTDYRTNGKTQIRWGLNYIKNRYGSPGEAWSHSQRVGWY